MEHERSRVSLASSIFGKPPDGALEVRVRDDGIGGADLAGGSGLIGLKDRVSVLGGQITLESHPGAGTELSVELPLARAHPFG